MPYTGFAHGTGQTKTPPVARRGDFVSPRAFGLTAADVSASLLVDSFHRQLDLAAIGEAEQLDLDHIAFLDTKAPNSMTLTTLPS